MFGVLVLCAIALGLLVHLSEAGHVVARVIVRIKHGRQS